MMRASLSSEEGPAQTLVDKMRPPETLNALLAITGGRRSGTRLRLQFRTTLRFLSCRLIAIHNYPRQEPGQEPAPAGGSTIGR